MKRTTRKYGIVFGAVALALVVLLSSTAVSQVNGKAVNDIIESKEQYPSFSSTTNDLNINSIEDLLVLIDMDGFTDHLTSENFADFVKSDDMQNIIASDLFLNIYNTQAVQDFIQSDIFTDFYNSDEAQIFLSNYLDGDDQDLQINGFSNENILPLGYDEAININSMAINVLGEGPSILFLIYVVFVGLVIGVLTYIPAYIVLFFSGLNYLVYSLENYLEEGTPNPVARAVIEFFIIFFISSFELALIWPFVVAARLAWEYWNSWNGEPNTTQMITEEQYYLMQEQVLGSSYIPASTK